MATMECSEIEFLAENEQVRVVPNFAHQKIFLISGDIGPFVPGMPLSVPLWMAINLKQRQKCRVLPPDWMDVDILRNTKQDEADSRFFTSLPCRYYMEITQLLLQYASDDVPRADELRTLVKDIWDLRLAKLRSSIDLFMKSDLSHAKLNFLTTMEINTIRTFLTKGLDHLHPLRSASAGKVSSSQSSQSSNYS